MCRFKFHQGLFIRVQFTISHYCFRSWLGAIKVPSYYQNNDDTYLCTTRPPGIEGWNQNINTYLNEYWYTHDIIMYYTIHTKPTVDMQQRQNRIFRIVGKLTHWSLRDSAIILKVWFSNSIYRIVFWELTVKVNVRASTDEKWTLVQVMAWCC